MKFLKKFNDSLDNNKNLNESVEVTKNWISEVMNTCKDIMIELEDDGIQTEVRRSLDRDESVLIECIITSNNRWRKSILLDVNNRLKDYMESEGFELVDNQWFSSGNQFKISFKKSNIDREYIGHLRYLKKYKPKIIAVEVSENIKESFESEEFYKDLTDKLFYELSEYFIEEKKRFMPIKVILGKNNQSTNDGKSNIYYGSVCFGPGWAGRMNDEEEDWLFDLLRTYREEYGIDYGACADSFGHGYFYERKNNAWEDGQNFMNLPDYPFPERL